MRLVTSFSNFISETTLVATSVMQFSWDKYPNKNNLHFKLKGSKLDSDVLADGGENAVDGIEQVIGGLVVLGPKPTFFQFLPETLNDVVMGRIRRQVLKSKRLANIKKHHIDFVDCHRVFDGAWRMAELDLEPLPEQRFKTIGFICGRVVSVVLTLQGDHIRFISARKATKREELEFKQTLGNGLGPS